MSKFNNIPHSYKARLAGFLSMMEKVRSLDEVMDTVAFKDTEAALETALYNQQQEMPRRKSR